MSQLVLPLVLAGGSGARLWPESRAYTPKQFLTLTTDRPMIAETVSRALTLCGGGESPPRSRPVLVVTGAEHAQTLFEMLVPLLEEYPAADLHILSEPCARNTAPAIALAARYAAEQFGAECLLWSLPADHHITDLSVLGQALGDAVSLAAGGENIVIFGVPPSRPETGYGYILKGSAVWEGRVFAVDAFTEKPDFETACAWYESGRYLWNSGMSVFTAGRVLAEIAQYAPDVLAACPPAAPESYAALAPVAFDRAVLEKTSRALVVPCDPGWSDIGSWQSLWACLPKDENGNACHGRILSHKTRDSLIRSQNPARLIACAGVEDLVIVDTGDSLLIAKRSDPQSLQELLALVAAADGDVC